MSGEQNAPGQSGAIDDARDAQEHGWRQLADLAALREIPTAATGNPER